MVSQMTGGRDVKKVSQSTVGRLSLYLRLLAELQSEGVRTLSSGELASRCGTTAAQVRKDLSFFGTFGKRGLGNLPGRCHAASRAHVNRFTNLPRCRLRRQSARGTDSTAIPGSARRVAPRSRTMQFAMTMRTSAPSRASRSESGTV